MSTVTKFASRATYAILVCLATAATTSASGNPTPWSGKWRVDLRGSPGVQIPDLRIPMILTLTQKGNEVRGSFPWQLEIDFGLADAYAGKFCRTGHGGTLVGRARGKTLTATMDYPAREGHPRMRTTLKADLSRNGRLLEGYGAALTGKCATAAYGLTATRVGP